MNKHAYLIIAHNEFGILEKLIKLIDDERNDIYIHIDKKVKNFDFKYFKNLCKYSDIYFVERINVVWGTFSQIEAELCLIKATIKNNSNYKYIHLLSGVDMPIKSQSYIHEFLDNSNYEYIHFTSFDSDKWIYERVGLYHILGGRRNSFVKMIRKIFILIQRILKINRIKDMKIYKGANWFSITREFAEYIISKEDFIRNTFNHSYCADEVFIQTLIMNSEFKNNLFNKNFDNDHYACLRCIDWKRGNPWVFRKDDYDMLVNSKAIFARKFSEKVDKDIVHMIYKYVKDNG